MKVRFLVTSYEDMEMYTAETPEEAVSAFLHEHPSVTKATVFVADFIGTFEKQTTIARLPNPVPTKPDRPSALAAERHI